MPGSRHVLSEIDSSLLDNSVSSPAITTAATDLNTRALQIVEALAVLAGGSATTNWATAINSLPVGADNNSLFGAINNATAAATASRIVKRDGTGGAAFAGTLSAAAISASGATSLTTLTTSGAVTIGGVLTAGSNPTTITDTTGKVLSAALATVQPAQGGTGATALTAGNVLVGGGAGAVTTTKAAPSGNFVGDTDTQTLTNKTLTTPTVNGATLAGTLAGAPTFSGTPIYAAGVTHTQGTITADTPFTSATAIWNNAAVSFHGLLVNVTNNASAAGSRLFDFQIGGASRAALDTAGNLTVLGQLTAGSGAHAVTTAAGLLDMTQTVNTLPATQGGTGKASTTAGALLLGNGTSALTELTGTSGQSVVWSGSAWAAGTPGAVPLTALTGMGAAGNILYSNGTNVVSATAATAIPDYSLPMSKMSEFAITPNQPANLSVNVAAGHKWTADGTSLLYIGGSIDLTGYVPASPSNNVYVLLEINSTPALLVKAGTPVPRSLVDSDRPKADANTTPIGYIALAYGQTQITAASIYPWIGMGGFPGSAIAGGSVVGHIHGAGSEVRQPLSALDDGYVQQTSSPSLQVLVSGVHYRNSSGTTGLLGAGTFGAFALPASGFVRAYGLYFDPSSTAVAQTSFVDTAVGTTPVKPTFSGNQRSLAIVYLRSGSTVIKNGDDGVNGYIEDARVILAGSAPASTPVGVSDGGTGSSTYATPGLVYASGTTPFTTVAASTSTTLGLGITPTVTPGSSDASVMQAGGGTVSTGTTNFTNLYGLDVQPPTKTGTGTITNRWAARFASGAISTNDYGLQVASPSRFGGTTAPTKTVDITGTLGVSGATTLAGTLTVSTANAGGITQDTWVAPTLVNSWANFGGTVASGYFKDAMGFVRLRGFLASGTAPTMFTLPAGFRPSSLVGFAVPSNNAFGYCSVDSSGNVAEAVGSNTWFSICGINFDTR